MVTASLSMANSGLAPSERKKREIAKLIQLRGAGWTQQEVADEIGKSRQWVQGKLKEIKMEKGDATAIKEILVEVAGNLTSTTHITIDSGNDFEKIREDRPVIYDKNQRRHVVVREGVAFCTPDRGLPYSGLMDLISRGLAVEAPPQIKKQEDRENDRHSISFEAWNKKLDRLKHTRKIDSFLSSEWLLKTDFKSEKEYFDATTQGYFSSRDFKAGTKGGFSCGPVYYLAKEMKLDAEKVVEAMKYGISDSVFLDYLLEGGFEDRHQAENAKERGFSTFDEMKEAEKLGCNTKDQMTAIKKHGWPDLPTFQSAERMGFRSDELDLFIEVRDNKDYSEYWNHISRYSDEGALSIMRTTRKLVDFQIACGYEELWQAAVLDYLHSAKGNSVAFSEVLAVSNIPHPFEECDENKVQEFLINDDHVNKLGRAIPRDRFFEFGKGRKVKESIQPPLVDLSQYKELGNAVRRIQPWKDLISSVEKKEVKLAILSAWSVFERVVKKHWGKNSEKDIPKIGKGKQEAFVNYAHEQSHSGEIDVELLQEAREARTAIAHSWDDSTQPTWEQVTELLNASQYLISD